MKVKLLHINGEGFDRVTLIRALKLMHNYKKNKKVPQIHNSSGSNLHSGVTVVCENEIFDKMISE